MQTHYETIKSLKSELDALQPLSTDHDRRLWQKLRLEWNYHSNHIEGNTLTYGETVLLLLHGQTHGNHTLREYEEMKAHDVGIAHLRNLAADRDRLIGPGDIRDLNRIILKEPYWKPTQSADGLSTRAEVVPGEYKTLPNSVFTATGELFEYAPPMDVPARMQALVDWLTAAIVEDNPPILKIAAKLHHDFVLIHPFDDGNGRVARMLVNYLFLRFGYPPIVVPTEEKSAYLSALRLADAGDLMPLTEFFAKHLERSLNLAIRAGRGESIEEPSDVEKQVELFIRGEKAKSEVISLPDKATLEQLMESSLVPFVEAVERKLQSLKPLFGKIEVTTENLRGTGSKSSVVSKSQLKYQIPGGQILITFEFIRYRGQSSTPFDHTTMIGLHFPAGRFTITHDGILLISKAYTDPLFSEEIDDLSARILAKTFELIKTKASSEE